MFHDENDFTSSSSYHQSQQYGEQLAGDLMDMRNNDGDSALHIGSAFGDGSLVENLLKFGCQVNARNHNGDTPLMFAVRYKNAKAVRILLDNGADIGLKNNNGEGPLHYCRSFDHKHIVKMLYEVIRTEDETSLDNVARMFVEADCPLCIAVFTKDIELIKVIANRRGVANESDEPGCSALHAAISEGSLEAVRYLLDLGAPVKNDALNTVVASSLRGEKHTDHQEMLQLLLDHDHSGAGVNELWLDIWMPLNAVGKSGLGKLILRHLAKLELLGRPMIDEHARVIENDRELSGYLEACKRELERMREERAAGRVTFLELLTGDANTAAGYARNQQLNQTFARGEYEKRFPLYREALRRNFVNGKRRNEQITAARAKLHGSLFFNLPEVTDQVLCYLSGNDLDNICLC